MLKLLIVAWALYNGPVMRCAVILCAAIAAGAEMPSGYFRGPMAGWEGSVTKGELRARSTTGEIFTCGFDAKTYMEFEKRRVTIDKLREGDPLEVLAYRRAGETACYVLSLTVVIPQPKARPNRRIDMSPSKEARAPLVRHGAVNASGVVVRVDAGSLVLRTRDGEEVFLLRRDTRYFGNGLKMEQADIHVNQRLAVEAGRNSEGKMEAFQLTWGDLSAR